MLFSWYSLLVFDKMLIRGVSEPGLFQHVSKAQMAILKQELISCLDRNLIYQMRLRLGLSLMEHYERHWPLPEIRFDCFIPPPSGYKIPIKWPKRRDKVLEANIPHTHLAEELSDQNWMVVKDEENDIPGDGSHFHYGAHKYIRSLANNWFDDALVAALKEPNAMALYIAGNDGKPSSWMVLVKGFDKDGFFRHTNYGSRKAKDLSEDANASLLFYWDGLNRQDVKKMCLNKSLNNIFKVALKPVRLEQLLANMFLFTNFFYFSPYLLTIFLFSYSIVIPRCDFLYQGYKDLEVKSQMDLIPKPEH